MCRKSIRSHPQQKHFGIQNFPRDLKKCATLHNVDDPTQPKLFSKQESLASGTKCQVKAPVVATTSNQQ